MTSSPTLQRLSVRRTARIARLGTPSDASVLWVVLHGYGQLATDFIESFGSIGGRDHCVLAPEGLSRFYVDGSQHEDVGASWMTREDREQEIADYVAYLDAVVDDALAEETAASVRALGFSQGAATASRWALLGDTPVDKLVLWGGAMAHDLDLSTHAPQLREMVIVFVAGTEDPYMSPGDREQVRRRFDRAGVSVAERSFEGGHRLDDETLEAVFAASV